MRKPRKSLKAVAITFLIGFLVPAVFRISGVDFLNKIAWKGLLYGASVLATVFVRQLYSLGLIKGKRQGGKTRIGAYIAIVLLLCLLTPTKTLFVSTTTRIIQIITGLIVVVIMTYVAYKIIGAIKNFFSSGNVSKLDKDTHNQKKREASITQNSAVRPVTQSPAQNIIVKKQPHSPRVLEEKELPAPAILPVETTSGKLKTILQLWNEKSPDEKCITITNDENPDLRWVKIYRPRYRDGNFYGYIKMQHARDTVNGIIYSANKPIWYET